MCLISCPKCHSHISEESENCPKCGYPISSRARLKWAIQPSKHKKRIIDAQSVYAWLLMVVGFILIIALPYESAGGIVSRAFGTGLIIVGLVWGVVTGLGKWWGQ